MTDHGTHGRHRKDTEEAREKNTDSACLPSVLFRAFRVFRGPWSVVRSSSLAGTRAMLSHYLTMLLALGLAAPADDKVPRHPVKLVVTAPQTDREGEPVCVPLTLPKRYRYTDDVVLTFVQNKKKVEIIGQLTDPGLGSPVAKAAKAPKNDKPEKKLEKVTGDDFTVWSRDDGTVLFG